MNNRFLIKLASLENELSLLDTHFGAFHFGCLLDEFGFCVGNACNSTLIDIEALQKLPGAIVIAEAGMGKTFVMKCIKNSFPVENSLFLEPILFQNDLHGFNRELNNDKQHIIIDGLDENADVIPSLIRHKEILLEKTNLIISSRNIKEVKSLQERLKLPVYVLLPLSQELVIQLAQEAEIDGPGFLDCVKQKGLTSICAIPQGCQMLIDHFKAGKLTNIDSDNLWESSIKLLCSENDSVNSCLKSDKDIIPPNECLDMASKIALILKLSGKVRISRIDSSPHNNELDFSIYFDRNNWQSYNSILSRPIFTSVGENCFRFAHKTYFDYCASIGLAKYISPENIAAIVYSSEHESIYPQWEDAMAWFAVNDNKWMKLLLEKQPELLLHSDSLMKLIGTAKLCEALIKRSRDLDYWNINNSLLIQRLHCLKSSEIIPCLQRCLNESQNNSEREMSINIIRECRIKELENELATIFCNEPEDHSIRLSAGYTLIGLASESSRKKCLSLLADENCSSDFVGLIFQMTWPHLVAIREMWPHIAAFNKHRMDSLWTWMEFDFPKSLPNLSEDKSFEVLEWLIKHVDINSDYNGAKTMLRQTLTLCWNKFCTPKRYELIFRGVMLFSQNYEYPFFEKAIHEVPDIICCSSGKFASASLKRREWAKGIMNISDINGQELTNISCLILDENDISFIFEQTLMSSDVLSRKWCNCLKGIQGWVQFPEHKDNWNKVHNLFPDIFPCDADQIIIEREKSKREWLEHEQKWHKQNEEHEKITKEETQTRINLVKQLITEYKTEECFTFIANSIICTTPSYSFCYSESAIWKSLSENERNLLLDGTKDYIRNQAPFPLEENTIHFCSIFALHLLASSVPDIFQNLPTSAIKKHSEELFSWLECDNRRDELSLLLRKMIDDFPGIVSENMLLWIRQEMGKGHFPNLERIKEFIFSDALSSIIKLIENAKISDKLVFLALNEIRKVSYADFKALVERRLSSSLDDISKLGHRFSIFALDLKPELITNFVLQFEINPSWGKEWLENVVSVNKYEYPLLSVFSKASLETLTQLYIWLHSNFPSEKEPRHEGAYTPNTDDMIYEFIRGVFSLITDYESENVESALAKLYQTFPGDKWLNDCILRARRKDLFHIAPFFSFEQILKLISDRKSRVINSAHDLLAIVCEALKAYQIFLTGTKTPRVEDLWNNFKDTQITPKHEEDFSDHVKSYLDILFKKEKIIVNREVELNRGRNGEAGARTDIWIDSFTYITKQKISLCIEVKGSWNPSAKSAMNDQLIAKYMDNDGADAGILLIGWFQSVKCHQTGNIWHDDRNLAKLEIEKQEQEANKNKRLVRGIVIDCDYKK